MSKPTLPKGTRDFLPHQVAKREHIFGTIRDVFKRYGYQGIETPAMESLTTLTGKYGEEGDQLLFKVLNNGDYLKKADQEALEERDSTKLVTSIAKRGLRYDLTVPFARYVVMHQNDLQLPFKRYAIQPVWRADRPQRGRFREFFQCDADVVGSDSLLQEVELVQLYDEAFSKLGLNVNIRINNRKILAGIAEVAGIADKLIDFTVALDKLDKIGEEGVLKEMSEKGISDEQLNKVIPIIQATGSNLERLQFLAKYLESSEIGRKGVEELSFVLDNVDVLGLTKSNCILDITLARGLNYYTGAIFEVEVLDVKMGSVGGGGRYDDLTGIFGMKNLSGVGISFGLDRIYLCLDELELFPTDEFSGTTVLFANYGEQEALASLKVLKELRGNNVASEIYPSNAKMKKQFDYASKKGIPFLAMIGSDEMANNLIKLKNLESGEQEELNLESFLNRFA